MSDKSWLNFLSDEDRAFVRRFVLASGPLKDVAQQYGVTYPTIRNRLDRLITKIKAADDEIEMSAFERLLRVQFADGKINPEIFKLLLSAHHRELEKSNDSTTD